MSSHPVSYADIIFRAERYIGEVREFQGSTVNHPFIQWCLMSCGYPADVTDEVPWCSAFVNRIAWDFRLPRSKSAAARSWLAVGRPIALELASSGCIVILKRGDGNQPGPEVIKAPGHVGFYYARDDRQIYVLGGNQGNAVDISPFPVKDILGVRSII